MAGGRRTPRLDDFRFAIHRLRKDAGTTIASIAALACGIGAAVSAWSLVSAVLLEPLPIEGADRLFQERRRGSISLARCVTSEESRRA